MKKIRNLHLFSYFIVFVLGISLFTAALTLVFCIPNQAVIGNGQSGIAYLEQEGSYPQIYFETNAAQLDNYTDQLMLKTALAEGRNPLEAAMSMGNYARYWHGYQVLLRVLLVFFNYEQIRYGYIMLFFILLTAVLLALQKRIGKRGAFGFVISLCALYPLSIPASMQFSHVFLITFGGILVLLRWYTPQQKRDLGLFFFAMGMVVNFVDLLTAPLLTLGIPLLIYFCMEIESRQETNWQKGFRTLVTSSLAWGLGYGGCWLSKWLLASVILKQNVVADALESMFFRIGGNENYPLDRAKMLQSNFELLFSDTGKRIFLIWMAVLLVLFLLWIGFHKEKRLLLQGTLLLMIAAYPYLWFMVLANHSDIHAWFVYRIQWITLLGVAMYFLYLTDFKRCAAAFRRYLPRRKEGS